MSNNQIPEAMQGDLQEVFDRVFLSPVKVSPELSPETVEEWDSMTHINLLMSLEQQFAVKFTTIEIEGARTLGDFAALIASKRG